VHTEVDPKKTLANKYYLLCYPYGTEGNARPEAPHEWFQDVKGIRLHCNQTHIKDCPTNSIDF